MRIGALEAGGTKMVMAIGNEKGEIIERISIPTESPQSTMPKLIAFFKEREIEKLGIGSFGPVCLDKGNKKYGHILDTPKLTWRNYDILGDMKRKLQVPCYLDTDVNAAAVGEATWGNASDVRNSIYITVGTGIGAGIIVDGKPVHGLMHPEAGHILVKRLRTISLPDAVHIIMIVLREWHPVLLLREDGEYRQRSYRIKYRSGNLRHIILRRLL